jgi:hypothetical protein
MENTFDVVRCFVFEIRLLALLDFQPLRRLHGILAIELNAKYSLPTIGTAYLEAKTLNITC